MDRSQSTDHMVTVESTPQAAAVPSAAQSLAVLQPYSIPFCGNPAFIGPAVTNAIATTGSRAGTIGRGTRSMSETLATAAAKASEASLTDAAHGTEQQSGVAANSNDQAGLAASKSASDTTARRRKFHLPFGKKPNKSKAQ